MSFNPLPEFLNKRNPQSPVSHDANTNKGGYISTDFRQRILGHLIKNGLPEFDPALYLGIQGPPGEGKSYQLRATLAQARVYTRIISGSELSGQHEGDSLTAISDAYLAASQIKRNNGAEAAIIVDDFDLSVASQLSSSQYTVNSQLLCGFLMNLADNPASCKGVQTERIPIFFTGNNLKNLYRPLVRHGRFDIFDWKPDMTTKYHIVKHILFSFLDDEARKSLPELIKSYSSEPISFFSMLRSDIFQAHMNTWKEHHWERQFISIKEELRTLNFAIGFSTLKELARRRAAMRTGDFL